MRFRPTVHRLHDPVVRPVHSEPGIDSLGARGEARKGVVEGPEHAGAAELLQDVDRLDPEKDAVSPDAALEVVMSWPTTRPSISAL